MKTQKIETTLFFIEQLLEYNYIIILLHVNVDNVNVDNEFKITAIRYFLATFFILDTKNAIFRAKFQDGRTFQTLHSFLRNTWIAYGYLEFHVTYVGILTWLIICCYLYGRFTAQLSLFINFTVSDN